MADPVKLPRVTDAELLNSYLTHAEAVLDKLMEGLGDGTAQTITVESLDNLGKRQYETSELENRYEDKKDEVKQYQEDWESLDTNIADIAGMSASVSNTVRTEVEELVKAIKEIVGDVPKKPDLLTQITAVANIDKAVTEAAGDVSDAYEELERQSRNVDYGQQPTTSNSTPPSYGGGYPTATPAYNRGYQPTASPAVSNAAPQPMGAGQKVTADKIYQRLIEKHGLTPAQAAGIVGNLQTESGFDTGAYNPGEGAIGLAQWRGGRRAALEAFAASRGQSVTDWDVQVDFLVYEMRGGEGVRATETTAWAHLQSAQSPGQAAAVFDQYYERSSGHARAQRIANANNFAANHSNIAV